MLFDLKDQLKQVVGILDPGRSTTTLKKMDSESDLKIFEEHIKDVDNKLICISCDIKNMYLCVYISIYLSIALFQLFSHLGQATVQSWWIFCQRLREQSYEQVCISLELLNCVLLHNISGKYILITHHN